MNLKTGVWKLYRNSVEGKLINISVDEKGYLQGKIRSIDNYEMDFSGTWDKAGQVLTFGPIFFSRQSDNVIGIMEYHKGFLFSIPSDPEPGKDML